MVWGRTTWILLSGVLGSAGVACGPEGQMALDTDSEGETESEGTTGGSATTTATATATATATMTAGSMSGTATTTASTSPDDTGPVLDSSGDDPPPETETGECPYGTEGCLCDVGAACDEGLDCSDEGLCVAPPACEPLDTDPHDDEATALAIDDLGCGDTNDLGVVATLEGAETDWYAFVGGEAFMCPERPAAAVVAAIPTEVCVFLECLEGGVVMLQCAEGSTAADSPEGRPGCCGEDQAGVFGYDCSGFGSGKDIDVYIAVSSADEDACEDYALSYAQ